MINDYKLQTNIVEVLENLADSNEFIVEFIISGWVRQEGISICYEQVQNL